jgi:hypothetical protein
MQSFDLKLTAEGMKNIPPTLLPNDFGFVVGSATYQCPRLVAIFLSPKIAKLYSLDPTIAEYWVETEDRHQQFSQFLSLGSGSGLVVNHENRCYLLSVARELENDELHNSIMSEMGEGLSIEKVCALGGSDRDFFENMNETEIEFLASNLWALDWPTLNNIPLSTLFNIFGHPSLRIYTETWLYCFIFSKLPSGREYFQLFQFVRFEHAQEITRHHFLKLWREYPEFLETALDAIETKFCLADDERPEMNHGRYTSSNDPNWMFDRLEEVSEGNLHDLGIVTLTTKSNSGADWSDPKHILHSDSDTAFQSADEPNQWICCDFHDRRVVPAFLQIGTNGPLPLSIEVEGSIDGDDWTRFHCSLGVDSCSSVCWQILGCSREGYRFVRMTQIGMNSEGNHRLDIQWLDFGGTILDDRGEEDRSPNGLERGEES